MYKYEYIVECRLTLKNIYLLGDAPLSKTEIFFLYTCSFIIFYEKLVKICIDCLTVWKNHVSTHYCRASRYNSSFKCQCFTNSSLSERILLLPGCVKYYMPSPVVRRSVSSYLSVIAAGVRNYRVCIVFFVLSKKTKCGHLNK